MAPILEVKNLRKNFKDFSLKDISFTLDRGYIMGFIGPNGAGKTTTIKLIMNLLKKDSGEVKIFGYNNDDADKEIEIKNKIGFVFGESIFYEELTVEEMKGIIAPFYKNWDERVFNDLIRDFSLPKRKKIKELSKGMKIKFSLAVALSHNAELLIMDEPISGLDPIVRSELLDFLSEFIQDENKSVFISTHITSDLDKIADYITFINDGSIVFSSPKDDIFEYYSIVKGPKDILDEDIKKYFVGIRENKFGFEGLVKERETAKILLQDKVIFERPCLEDIMFYFTRGKINV
ncbi:ABC transporter ATP-binding protein [Thermovenabulum gondwanense]|uniref:ABC transporter ATP-binding protein YtrB n=1 Tax=Thermovenabulum gondwanense TaxID=520767 RepID=A0A162MF82_9FIRM|nr:ABC transporter ATP-binding protein [Thermovenabulum gondwanense]KYO65535.1 ABC transporter ATP-binding protein YtrB [Thermovenabulum gondwanense]